MNKLYIDTTNNKEVIVRLLMDTTVDEVRQEIQFNRGQVVLPIIQKLLSQHNLTPRDLDAVEVNEGPGSFTGVRVGVSIANAIAFALQIPVNGKIFGKDKKLVEPVYT